MSSSPRGMSEKFREVINKLQSLYHVATIDRMIGFSLPLVLDLTPIGFINHVCQHPNYGKTVTVPGHGFFRLDNGAPPPCLFMTMAYLYLGLFINGILTLFNKNIVHRDATFLSKSVRTCPLSGMPHGSLVHAQIERSCEIINGLNISYLKYSSSPQDILILIMELSK